MVSEFRRRLRGIRSAVLRRRGVRFALLQAVLVIGVAILLLPAAVLTAEADRHFGPHEATYSIDLSGEVVVDLGPLGTIIMPADDRLPLHLGVRAEIKEIPEELGAAAAGGTIEALTGDITAYGTFFAQPQALIDDVVRGLIADIAVRWAIYTLLGLLVLHAIGFLMGRPRRVELSDEARRHPWLLTASASLVLLLVAAGLVVQTTRESEPAAVGSPVFTGTPLEGARVTGRMAGVVDEVGGVLRDFYDDNEEFYAAARSSLVNAAEQADAGTVRLSPLEALPRPDKRTEAELTTILMVSDVHCNVGMAEVVDEVFQQFGPQYYIDAGDVTMTGTPAEDYCVDASANAVPSGVPKLFVKGNHDSLDTVAAARRAGFTVLEGEAVDFAGLRVFGAGDPRHTRFGASTLEDGPVPAAEFGPWVAEGACAVDGLDLLVVHDPRSAWPTLSRGCAPLSISGHWHRRVDPHGQGLGIQYVNSTTGGALADALTPGPLRMDAEMTLLRFDPETGAAVDWRVITVDETAQAQVGPWRAMPRPPAVPTP